jgi:L-iditol 2-dehydrogenase
VVEIAQLGYVEVGDRVVVMPQYPCGQCSLCISGEYIHCESVHDCVSFTGSAEGSATYAQYMLKPAWLLAKIPDGMSYEHAGMLCCGLGPTHGAMEKMGVGAFDTVLITGMGPVGLGGIINAVFRCASVIAIVGNPYRAGLAKELGAEAVFAPGDNVLEKIMDFTNGVGVDMAIDCAGNPSAQCLAIDATRRQGAVAFVGESGDLTVKVSDQLIRKGLSLHGIWHYNIKNIPMLFKVAGKSKALLDKMITHTFPMRNVKDAWELQMTRQCGKVILYPWP